MSGLITRMALIAVGALSLTACAQQEAAHQCKKEVGPEPYAGLGAFALVGTLAMQSTDAHAAWRREFSKCMHGRLPDWKEPWP